MMFETVYPLRAIAFQLLFLLIAIAIESLILRRRLNIDRQTSLEYAAFMNLLTIVLGWYCFLFLIEPLLSPAIKSQFISFIFFDKFHSGFLDNISHIVFVNLVLVAAFFITFYIKAKSLEYLQKVLSDKPRSSVKKSKVSRYRDRHISRLRQRYGHADKDYHDSRYQAGIILWGHACSHSLILMILLLRQFGTF